MIFSITSVTNGNRPYGYTTSLVPNCLRNNLKMFHGYHAGHPVGPKWKRIVEFHHRDSFSSIVEHGWTSKRKVPWDASYRAAFHGRSSQFVRSFVFLFCPFVEIVHITCNHYVNTLERKHTYTYTFTFTHTCTHAHADAYMHTHGSAQSVRARFILKNTSLYMIPCNDI